MSDHPLTRENAATKARRLLAEGRIRIRAASESERFVAAEVRGDSSAIYSAGYEADAGGWWCSCPAKGVCSHILALQLITVLEPREGS